VKYKNLLTGSLQERTFRAGESIVPADLIREDVKFMYPKGKNLIFVNMATKEEVSIEKSILENHLLLREGL
jgi:elongation factor P